MAGDKERTMTKKAKVLLATAAAALAIGAIAPAASADSAGQTAYGQVVKVTSTTAGRVATRLLEHAIG